MELLYAGGIGVRGEILDGSGKDGGEYRDERVDMDGWNEGRFLRWMNSCGGSDDITMVVIRFPSLPKDEAGEEEWKISEHLKKDTMVFSKKSYSVCWKRYQYIFISFGRRGNACHFRLF